MANYRWNWLIFFEEVATGGERYYQWLLAGLGWTVAVSLLAWCLALALGLAIGTLRTTPLRWLTLLGDGYVEVFRNIPLIVQMFLWFFVLPEVVPTAWGHWLKQEMPLPELTTAVISLAFFTAARIAEQVKAGLLALPPGQSQAALALGLTGPQAYRYVLLPVALRLIIPPLTSELMNIFKNSSVALTIGLLELTAVTRRINEYTFQSFEVFTLATLLYALVALIANAMMGWIEARTALPGYGIGRSHD